MKRGALLYNPVAGRRRGEALRDGLCAALRTAGWEIDATPTSGPGQATSLAAALAREGRVEAVFAVGGDGTLREVAAGLLGSDVALAPLPAGTTNVLVRALGVPRQPLLAARALATGVRRPLAVGICGATPFLMMVSAGLDAAVMAALSGERKKRRGQLAVLAQGFDSWRRYAYPQLTARWNGEERSGSFACVCNVPLYAGSLAMVPAARWDDDALELVLFHGAGRLATLSFAADLLRGRHLRRQDVTNACVEELELLGPPELPLQVDGDPCAETLPARVRVAPERLTVLVPASR
ncbi:MAG TPA: diacylglycerol kinase family protein [Thermoanaerobaculia bacterium]|nr:diacylglycerol kinase family protein [Thermoanaerobaculia bacterium]